MFGSTSSYRFAYTNMMRQHLQIEVDPTRSQVLKLLREELRPALQKCWGTEAANVASAVAASEDDRASTATNSIDFIKGQLVQNGAEAAQKLRDRLAGAWRSKEAGASQEKQLQAPEIFGDGEQWQRACESRLEEVRNWSIPSSQRASSSAPTPAALRPLVSSRNRLTHSSSSWAASCARPWRMRR